MRNARRPVVESLEEKCLLTSVAGAEAVVPSTASGLKVTLATNQKHYHQGQAVAMRLTETNTTNHAVTLTVGPGSDGFDVTKNGKTVWISNSGPQPQYLEAKTLQPGESFSLSATWNGHSNMGPAVNETGVLVVHSQMSGSPAVTIRIVM